MTGLWKQGLDELKRTPYLIIKTIEANRILSFIPVGTRQTLKYEAKGNPDQTSNGSMS